MKKIFSISLVLFAMVTLCFAGTTGKISGVVIDAETKEPLPGVNVYLENTTMGAATDIDGKYVIINIEPGTYTVVASSIGYNTQKITNVKVASDFTTTIDFEISSDVINIETVVIAAKTPLIRKDLTSSRKNVDASQIESLPVESVSQVLSLQAGIVQGAGGELHIKGGRSSEISYNVNGISVSNPYDNSKSVQISTNAIQELSVVSGTFNAEYGNALSGIVNAVTKEGGSDYTGSFSFYTGDFISTHDDIFDNIDDFDALNNQVYELTFGGPLFPGLKDLKFYLSGRYNNNDGYLYGVKQHQVTDHILYQNTDSMMVMATGDGSIVPMNTSEDLTATAKLTWSPITTLKFNYDFLYSNSEYQNYSHSLKYNPDANYTRYDEGFMNSLELKHVLSNSMFYSLKASFNINNFQRYLFPLLDASGNAVDFYADSEIDGYVPDPRYQERNRIQPVASNTFGSGGTQNWHFYQKTETMGLKFDLTNQVNNNHEVKFGFGYRQHALYYRNFEVINDGDQAPYIAGIGTSKHDKYKKEPVEFSAYIQDKMEFESMILNVGVRYDYFDAKSLYSVNDLYPSPNSPTLPPTVDAAGLLAEADAKHQISPRIGISFPITDEGIIHFSYGHFFQMPTFNYLYTNPEFKYDFSSGNPTFGNANLNPEKTVTYEIGLQQQLSENLAFDITAYFKDVRDLLALQQIRISSSESYNKYINKDYGNIKGFTFSLTKRRSDNDMFAASLDYTYQISEGSDTRSDAAFLDFASGRQSEKIPYPLDWDQTHTLNASLSFGNFKDWSATLVGRLGTGLPYTPRLLDIQVDFKDNSERRPSKISVDLLAEKRFEVFDMALVVFLKVFNLFDTLNENSVFTDTGRATYTLEKERGTTQLADRYAEEFDEIKSSEEFFVRPDYYLPPREVRLGVSIEF